MLHIVRTRQHILSYTRNLHLTSGTVSLLHKTPDLFPARTFQAPQIKQDYSTKMADLAGMTKQLPTEAVDLIESAKKAAAQRAVDDYFDVNMRWVGIGSGTTIQYVVEAIKEKARDSHILFVPTGFQSRNEIEKRGLIAIDMSSLPENVQLDVAFDGADEVDEEFNCVKGGGACLFQEKLVAMRAKKFVCVAGPST